MSREPLIWMIFITGKSHDILVELGIDENKIACIDSSQIDNASLMHIIQTHCDDEKELLLLYIKTPFF